MQEDGAHEPMVTRRMVLREVVAQVFGPWAPVNEKLALFDSVLDPVKTHVHGLGAFLLDSVVGKTYGCRVVGLDGRRWLRMS